MPLSDLIERLERAGEGDQYDLLIKARLALVSANEPGAVEFFGRFLRMLNAGAYESAALALAERVLPGWTVANICQQDDKTWFAELREGYLTSYTRVAMSNARVGYLETARPKTPALALCLALVRALQQGGGDA